MIKESYKIIMYTLLRKLPFVGMYPLVHVTEP